MIVDTHSVEMRWILIKFLKDSLDFLCDNPRAEGVQRTTWAKTWMIMNLSDEQIAKWMPRDDN